MAGLLVEVLLHYRAERKYLLHEFVVMPDHFHLLLTPVVTLERAVQFIKGGFSYRAKKEGIFAGEIWERASMTGESGIWRSTPPFAYTSSRIQ